MNTKEANYLINTVDSRHQSAQPILRKIVAGEATDDEVNAFCDEDSRYEDLRPVLRALAQGKKLDAVYVEEHIDSRHEPLKPLLLALAQGPLQADAA